MSYTNLIINALLIISGFAIGAEISKRMLSKKCSKRSYASRCVVLMVPVICVAVYSAYMYTETAGDFYYKILLVCFSTFSSILNYVFRYSRDR